METLLFVFAFSAEKQIPAERRVKAERSLLRRERNNTPICASWKMTSVLRPHDGNPLPYCTDRKRGQTVNLLPLGHMSQDHFRLVLLSHHVFVRKRKKWEIIGGSGHMATLTLDESLFDWSCWESLIIMGVPFCQIQTPTHTYTNCPILFKSPNLTPIEVLYEYGLCQHLHKTKLSIAGVIYNKWLED